ncbi:MAG: superoxide dismutase [Fe], partial [Pseudomonadota bacterium]
MSFELPPLPYSKTAFGDLISEDTFNYHHGKHHNAYVSKTNDAIDGTDHADKKLSEIIQAADGGLFNNAAQVWNHSFYWMCLSPEKKDIPTALKDR